MNELKLYENVVIGNFLYGLGATIRAKSSDMIVSSVNLLQQTPIDKSLGDVLLEFPEVVRLIEFKRPQNRSGKERENVERLRIAISNQKGNFLEISKSVHWFVETNPEKETFVSHIVPYIDAYSNDKSRYNSLEQFIQLVAEDAVNNQNRFSPKEVRAYLDLVELTFAGEKSGAGGLIFAINEKGVLQFVELSDMSQLKLQHRDFVQEVYRKFELNCKLMLAYEESLNQEPQIKKSLRRSGPSLGR
jgi:hypothetical protein